MKEWTKKAEVGKRSKQAGIRGVSRQCGREKKKRRVGRQDPGGIQKGKAREKR